MGPGYPDPMPAGSADPGAQCSDEQHMAPGAWSVKQEALPGVTCWSSGREDPRYRFNLPAMDRIAEGSEPMYWRLSALPVVWRRRITPRNGSKSTRLPRRSATNLRADQHLCADGELDAPAPARAATVHADGLQTLVGRRLYRTPTWLHFPDMAMASLRSAHPAGRPMLYLDWRC